MSVVTCDVFVLQVHTEFTRSRHGPIPAWAEGIKVFNYGGQKLQFSEQQRLLMIDRLAADSSSHYTYSKDMLSGAFVLCNVADEQRLSMETHKKLMMMTGKNKKKREERQKKELVRLRKFLSLKAMRFLRQQVEREEHPALKKAKE